MNLVDNSISVNYKNVLERINNAALSSGRNPDEIKLIVVTKGQYIAKIERAYHAGIRKFGENYVQEAISKIDHFHTWSDIEWHMIGHVQSRKARLVSERFCYVESLDSLKLAERLDKFAREKNKKLPVLLECNVSAEESKFGFPAWQEDKWDRFLIPIIEQIISLENLAVAGLMTMPPLSLDKEKVRPYFKKLRKLLSYLREFLPQNEWKELSMGMSADFEIAVEEGATIVRIGTAIMGPR
jgi:pyridoxal phosphate enzyme (YggS family)